jgi:hypothetical protein
MMHDAHLFRRAQLLAALKDALAEESAASSITSELRRQRN